MKLTIFDTCINLLMIKNGMPPYLKRWNVSNGQNILHIFNECIKIEAEDNGNRRETETNNQSNPDLELIL